MLREHTYIYPNIFTLTLSWCGQTYIHYSESNEKQTTMKVQARLTSNKAWQRQIPFKVQAHLRHIFANGHELYLSSSLDLPLRVHQSVFTPLDIILAINNAPLGSSKGDDGGKPAKEILFRLQASQVHQNHRFCCYRRTIQRHRAPLAAQRFS